MFRPWWRYQLRRVQAVADVVLEEYLSATELLPCEDTNVYSPPVNSYEEGRYEAKHLYLRY